MKEFAILIFGVLFYLTVLGLPVAKMLSRSISDGSKAGLYSLAPENIIQILVNECVPKNNKLNRLAVFT
jgi:hypothetical protein